MTLLVSFIDDVLFSLPYALVFVLDNYFIFFPRTRFVKWLNLFFSEKNFIIKTRLTSANWRTLPIHLLTPTVIILTTLRTITPFFVYFVSFYHHILLFKGLFVYGLRFFNNEISCFEVVFGVKAILAPARWSTESQIFKTWTMESETIRIFTFTSHCFFACLFFTAGFKWKFLLSFH